MKGKGHPSNNPSLEDDDDDVPFWSLLRSDVILQCPIRERGQPYEEYVVGFVTAHRDLGG